MTAMRYLSRMRSAAAIVVTATLLGSGVAGAAEDPAAPVVVEALPLTCLDRTFGAYGDSGQGWGGADSTYSAALSDGRVLFAFSDTFLPPVTPPSRPADAAFVHNSFVVRETDGRLSTIVGGTEGKPDSLLTPDDPSHWYWVGAATVLDGAVQVPLGEWRSTGPGAFDIEFVGSAVARFDEGDLRTPVSVSPLPRAKKIQWGQWIQPEGEFTYVYGVETEGAAKYLHIARVAGGDLSGSMSFWTGSEWSDAESASGRIIDGVNSEVSVHRIATDRYLLTTMEGNSFSSRMLGRYAPSPTGPFGPATTLYITPETGESGTYHDRDVYTYNAHVHPEFSSPTELVVSYNVNSFDSAVGGDVYRDISIYRPRFVTVRLGDHVDAPGAAPRPACV